MMKKTSTLDGHIFSVGILPYVVAHYNMEIPFPSGNFAEICKNGSCEEWLDLDIAKQSALKILEKQKQDPNYISRIYRVFNKKKEAYLEFFNKEIMKTDLTSLSDEELLALFHSFFHLYVDEYGIAAITYVYADALSDLLFKKLSKKFGDKAAEVIAVITHPEEEHFVSAQKKEMLKIKSQIVKEFGKEIFEKNAKEIESFLKNNNLYSELEEHSKNYFWIENNYKRKKILKPIDFLEKMKHETTQILLDDSSQKKIAYLQKLDEEERAIATLLLKGAELQDERKMCALLADHFVFTLLEDISKRVSIPFDLLVNSTPWELPKILNKDFDPKILEQRGKDWFTIYYDHKDYHAEIGFIQGRKYNYETQENVDEIKGTPASPGVVKGKVRVIQSEEEFSKMQEGEILVAGMTRPEYVPIMKKAKGIVTDEGGLTCHAAIVSRELKVPCIVGTLISTRVLKDGDLIELDANKGIIKIMKS